MPSSSEGLGDDSLGQCLVPLVQACDGETNVGTLPSDFGGRTDHVGEVARDFLCPRAGKDRHQRTRPAALLSQKGLVQRPIGQLVEVGMTDINGVGNASRVIPRRLERKAAQDLIDVLANLLHAPASPCPDLRRNEVKDRNAPRLGSAGNPPVQAGIVDQHHRIRPFSRKWRSAMNIRRMNVTRLNRTFRNHMTARLTSG